MAAPFLGFEQATQFSNIPTARLLNASIKQDED
jgi:hypothetical protein